MNSCADIVKSAIGKKEVYSEVPTYQLRATPYSPLSLFSATLLELQRLFLYSAPFFVVTLKLRCVVPTFYITLQYIIAVV